VAMAGEKRETGEVEKKAATPIEILLRLGWYMHKFSRNNKEAGL
jgi:hypothetical protein